MYKRIAILVRIALGFSVIATLLMMGAYTKTLQAAEPTEPTMEKQVAVQWVIDQSLVDISSEAAIKIVDYAYWHASRLSLDPMFILAVMRLESGFNQKAISREGAKGLMQVLPRYHRKELAGRNVYDPLVNMEVGTNILDECLKTHKGNMLKSLNCYSGGAGKKYLKSVMAYEKQLRQFVIFALFDKQGLAIAQN